MATKRKLSKPTPAQLRARKLFAERARAGAFKRKRSTAGKVTGSKKRRITKAPSPAQLAARAKFVAMVRARAKGKGKAKANSRGLSGREPAWVKRARKQGIENPLRFKSEKEFAAWQQKTGRSKPAAKKRIATKKRGMFSGLGKSIVRGLGMAHNPSKRQKRERKITRAKRQRIVAFRQHGIRPAKRRTGPGRLPNPKGQHLSGLPAKYQRMYEDVLASSGSKRIAAATTMKALKRNNPSIFSRVKDYKSLFGKRRIPGHVERRVRGKGSKSRRRGGGYASQSFRFLGAMSKGARRLPNPSPASVFSEFRGKDVRSKSKSVGHGNGHLTVAQLGQLRELKLSGKRLEFGGKALLCADGRKKIHIV